ncbi:MAG: TIM-barrel domain-containing protein [Anaerolineales bacterium]
MLPKWMFGYLQSKEAYHSQAELIEIVKEYRTRRLPLDGIVQDWRSWTGNLWGQKTLDPTRFPDPDGMMAAIHELHARLMISIWPNTDPEAGDNKEMKEHGCLLGNGATYDAFQPQGREIYWQQANRGLFSHGIDAWWCDCTEPFDSDWKGAFKPEPEERMRINTEDSKKYLDPEFINAYSLLHSQGIYEGQRGTTDLKRVVNLTRSAYPGQHRYGTITWSGDISATWDTLRRQIAAGLNFCVTGSPYWTLDIGGFFVKNKPGLWFWNGDFENGCEDLGYRELYLRWFQYATFLPIFRAHGTDTPREIWRFGVPGEPIYDCLVKFLKLRYRLLPYIYSLAGQVTQADYTIYRLLSFDFREDPNTFDIRDQFMFGPSFLVSPVIQPMYYGPNSTPLPPSEETRSVYLPAGGDWFDFWTDQYYSGGQTIIANASIDTMPLFVRSGSIVPLGPDIQYTEQAVDAALVLKIYTGCNGHFTLYEDEADNYNYEKGSFSTIEINWVEESGCLVLGERQGSFPGMKATLKLDIVLVGKHQASGEAYSIVYKGERLMVDLSKKNDSPWVVTFSPEDRLEDRLRKAAHVKPSEALLNWMEKEFIAFIHFGPNTFSGRQWGTGHEEPSTYAPAFLDPEQWVRVCADAGMKMVVFTLKHHDGFCQWFTDTTDHSIKNSPVKKDVADLLRKGCDANKVDLGIYLSPWDMNQRDRGLWNTEEYNQYFLSQLSELLTRYGRIDEIWFDGACGDYETWKNVPSYRPDSWYDYIEAVQPQAVFRMYDPYFYATEEKWEEIKTGKASLQWRGKAVRWVGNEDGKGRTDEWSVQPVFDRTIAENATFPDLGQEKYYQNAVGAVWYPLEVNTTILNQWFWNSSTATTKSLSELIEIFYNSIGNNGVLLLNISPDNTGLIPEDQISRLMELKEFIQHTFSTNLALGATVKATSETPNHKADSILDNDKMTYWTTDGEWDINTSKTTILFDLEQTRKFDNVLVQEYIREGQRVAEWSLEAWVGGSWKELVRHKTIGYKNIKRFETCTTDRVRLHILRSWDNPMICNFGLFLSSIPEEVVEEKI